jgi:1,2-phenylacetyl-CoA epoxidase catalytic subunit
VVDSLLDLSRGTAQRLARSDDRQSALLQQAIDRFWEELAAALEQGPVLQRSQELVCALLEQLKTTYLSQISRSGIEALIEELDELVTAQPATGQSGGQSGSPSVAKEAAGPAIPPA